MSYAGIIIIIIIVILLIVIAILYTVALDDLARIPDLSNSINNMILDNVTSIGAWIIIFLIFLIALGLTIGILIFYANNRNTSSNFAYYLIIALIVSLIGLIILEVYVYNEISIFHMESDNNLITTSRNQMFWALVLTIILFILSFFLLFF